MNRRATVITGVFLTVTSAAIGMEVWFATDSNPDTLPWTALISDYIPAPVTFLAIGILVGWLPGHFVNAYKSRRKTMFFDNPNTRKVIYLVTIVLAAIAIILKHFPYPWAANAYDAVTELVTYVAGLAGLVAAGNVTGPDTLTRTTVTPIPSPSIVTTTTQSAKP